MRQDRYVTKSEGYIYILANKYIPFLVKIGRTDDLERRITEINNHAGVPGKFGYIFYERVFDPVIVEKEVHRQIKAKLKHDGYDGEKVKEFFVVPSTGYAIQTTKKIISECRKNYVIQKQNSVTLPLFGDKIDQPKEYWFKKSGLCVVKWDGKFKPKPKKSPIGAATQYYIDEIGLFDDWTKKKRKKKKRKKKK